MVTAFPIFGITEILEKAILPIATCDESHFGGNVDFEGAPTDGRGVFGIQSDFRPLKLLGIPTFQFYGFARL